MKHVTILDLRVTHSFYKDGKCADFAIEPSIDTARLLRNHRCVMRPTPTGTLVSTAFEPARGQPFLPLPSSSVLRFHLTLENGAFALFTELDAVKALAAPLFTNAAPGGSAGKLALVAGATAAPRGVFADIEIHLDGWGIGEGTSEFVVAFEARQWRWAYYCVTDLVPNGRDLTIVDSSPAGTADVLVFSAANTTQLDAIPDPHDPIGVQLAKRYPALRRLRMISDKAVACCEASRQHLELRHGADRLCGPLPNPSMRRVARISTPGQPQDLLFEIVKYRARPI